MWYFLFDIVYSNTFHLEHTQVHLFDLSYEDVPIQSITLSNARDVRVLDFLGCYGGQSGVMVCGTCGHSNHTREYHSYHVETQRYDEYSNAGTSSGTLQIVDWRMRNALANSVRAFDSVSDLACEGDVVAACGTWCSSAKRENFNHVTHFKTQRISLSKVLEYQLTLSLISYSIAIN